MSLFDGFGALLLINVCFLYSVKLILRGSVISDKTQKVVNAAAL